MTGPPDASAPAATGAAPAAAASGLPPAAQRPRHVAIIMDGNGRWAQARGKPRIHGHQAGVRSVRTVAEAAAQAGLTQLTLYAFSVDNWKRPDDEVRFLMQLLSDFLVRERPTLTRNDVRLRGIGRIEGLPDTVQRDLRETEAFSAGHRGMTLCLALNYGGRTELVDAARRLATEVQAGRLRPDEIDEARLGGALYTAGMPDPDLLVRTGGEMRVSDFLLWQISYTELYVTPTFWPEFGAAELATAMRAYATRERRFGGLGGGGTAEAR